MKVLTPGRQQKGRAKILFCKIKEGGCGAQLLVEQSDLTKVQECHQGECEDQFEFSCGHCGTINYINVYDFP